MDNLANRIANLSPEQLAQVTQRLQQKRQGQSTIEIQPRSNPTFSLSFAQQRIWFLHQLQPESPLYNVPASIQIVGPLDVALLEQSLTALCHRHEPLRTVFITNSAGEPLQVIQPGQSWSLAPIDLQSLSSEKQQKTISQQAIAIATTPFNLTQGPPLRTALLRLNADHHILLLCFHHIIVDGWALGIFVQELTAFYETFQNQSLPPLSPLKIQSVDYAAWQRQWLQGEAGDRLRRYWLKQLQDVPTLLELPTDYPRPPVQSLQGARYPLHLGRSLTQLLKQFGQSEGVTLFITVLTAFKVLLYRYTGQTDLLVGTPVANRHQVATERLIDVLMNTLPLRTQLQEDWTFRTLLHRVRDVVIEANAHPNLPFEKLVEILQPARSRSYAPLLQVMLSVQTSPLDRHTCGNLTLKLEPLYTGSTQFDLVLNLLDTAEGLEGWLEYSTDLFAPETIHRMAGHLQTLLENSLVAPDCQIAQIPLLTRLEQKQQLQKWNNTAAALPEPQCIHQLFEQQVERTPDAVAVVFEATQLSYQALNTRANQLAQHLQSLGVGAETLVGLCVERSLEMIVGVLGILKAGGAYVPLDPSYPRERLRFMLQDAQVSVLVTQTQFLEIFPQSEIRRICLEQEQPAPAQAPAANIQGVVTAHNLAYVIYTSGSTGTPKGVQIQHQSVVNFLTAMQTAPGLSPTDQLAAVTTLAFDIAALEIYLPLIVGATVLVVPQAVTQDGHQLRAYLESTQATTLQATPATWQMLLAAGWSASSTSMTCLCGGEALSTEVARHLLSTKQALWNLYGPTETTIWSTRFCVDGTLFDEDFLPGGAIPIGYPLANTDIYVLDKHLQLVPVGIPGELHIGGIGLARGYRNRPRMTAEKFIPNPFREGRLYKTGDLVRYRSEGILEFLGRIDHQVKIRGFRIELGEIEAVLSRHQYVQQCVVAAREDTPDNMQLVAYVVGHDDLTVKALKAHLASQLPNYLIPDIVMPLAVLPLTPNGKIDRKALPTPSDQLRAELRQATEFVAPHTERQMRIATFFAEVLSLPVEHIGLHDDFFELGGHSLIATQLAARLRDAFEAELSLQVLFESPNVAALDALLSSDRTPGSTISAIIPAKRDGQPIPLAYAQERLWFLTQLTGVSATYNIATALSIQGPLDISLLQKAIDTVVHRHDILRTHFPLVEGTAIQYITPTGTVSLDVLEASDLGMSLSDWLTEIARCPFDLATGPLIRAALVRSSANAATLTITMHHIISDGWSLEIFTRELADLYRAYRRGLTSPLPPLPVQYADYTLWQRQWLTGDILDAQLSYWKQQLADAPALLELPTDHPRPAVQRFQGHTHSVSIPLSLTQALRALSQRHRVTLFITLLTGFQILLSRYSGQSDIVVGVPVANRRWGDLEPLIGFFANTLVLRTQLTSNETVTDLLQRVKRATLAAYTHQDVPFEQIVEALQPTRSLAYTPLFQVMFVLQNASLSSLALPDLTLTPLLAETTTAKFDLTLSMQETEQGLVGHWEYDTDLFEAETIARMTTHFETLLRAIAADAQQSVATLPLVTPPERQQLLADWNDTAADYPQGECIHQLFEQQVARTPKATAVVFETESLTYEALNRRANQLAHALQQLGVKPETLVGLCMERSLEMLVGLLGILKAGGAYVPLDPGYPPERLQFMLEDAQVPMLVTQQTIAADLPVHQARQVCLDTDWDSLIQPHKAHNPDSGVTPENLAYVIYTSGSTGQPKGVQGLHRGTVNRLRWMWDTYPFQPGEQCCQKTSLSFVDSVWEFFGGLLQGIPTRIIPNDIVKDPPRLIQTLSLNRISRIVLVPSLLSAILEADSELSQQLSHLKYWITSGEVLEASLCQKFCDSLPDSLLINLYGSSEVSADVTYHEIWQPQTSCSDTPLQFNDLANSVSTGDIAAAQKPTEEVLAEIWKQVLCLEKVGLHDSFFEIGGNRVSAAQVINKVRDVLDVSLPADSLQRASDIQGLAAMLKYYETEAGRTDTISRLLKQLQTPSGVNR